MDFSKLTLPQIYSIQHDAVTEVRFHENVVSYQASKETRKEKACKQVIKHQQEDLESQSQKQTSLEETIKEVVTELSNDEEEGEAELVHQLRWLSKLAADLKKQVQELKTNQQPSTPPEVVQQRQESTNQVVCRLGEAENICIEAVEVIVTSWEQLIKDEPVEQLVEQVRKEDL